jgi:hypothetical protein
MIILGDFEPRRMYRLRLSVDCSDESPLNLASLEGAQNLHEVLKETARFGHCLSIRGERGVEVLVAVILKSSLICASEVREAIQSLEFL